jgi:hypothetical protein
MHASSWRRRKTQKAKRREGARKQESHGCCFCFCFCFCFCCCFLLLLTEKANNLGSPALLFFSRRRTPKLIDTGKHRQQQSKKQASKQASRKKQEGEDEDEDEDEAEAEAEASKQTSK